MNHFVPVELKIYFGVTVLVSLLLLARALRAGQIMGRGRPGSGERAHEWVAAFFWIGALAWIGLQSAVTRTGFYRVPNITPPRFLLAIGPPVLLAVIVPFTKAGKRLIDTMSLKWTVLFHAVRILVEIGLLRLFIYGRVPRLMTFEGGNYDIAIGLTAGAAWWGYSQGFYGRKTLAVWNAIGLLSLLNAVGRALLSAPFPFQRFAFDQPTVAILHFPFVLLPAFIVPAALFLHIAMFRMALFSRGRAVNAPEIS